MDKNFELIKRELSLEKIKEPKKELLVLRGLNRLPSLVESDKYYFKAEEYRLNKSYSQRWEKAINFYKKAIELDNTNIKAYYGIIFCYFATSQWENIINIIESLIEIDPNLTPVGILKKDLATDDAAAHFWLGRFYVDCNKLDKHKKAIEEYEKALQLNPDLKNVHYNLGWAYIEIKEYYKSIELFKEAIIKEPNDADVYYSLGWVYGKLGKHENVIKMFKMAIRIRPKYIYAHYGLGLAYLVLEDRNMAIKEYDILKALDQNIAHKLFDQIYS